MAPRKPLRVASKSKARSAETGCGVGDLFRLLGKAHMLDILYIAMVEAQGQPRRFVDIQKQLRISPNTLSERLKELVEAGLLTRTAYNEIPPRVDYQATDKARELATVFDALRAWASKNDLRPVPAAAAPAVAVSTG